MRAYCTASKLADSISADSGSRAIMSYECGRALGAVCSFVEAHEYLVKALTIGEAEQIGPNLRFPLFELGRLNAAQANYEQAIPYYERALALTESSRSATKDPIGLSNLLDEYAEVLTKAGRPSDAASFNSRAAEIRSGNSNLSTRSDVTPYGKHCASRR